MNETPGKLLSSLSDGHKQSASTKKGGYMGAFFQLFDRNIKSSKKHPISTEALPQPGKEFNDDKLPMAKLLLIADENRGGFPSPKKIAASKELSSRGTNSRFPENGLQKRAPGLVARLMGLESLPDKKLFKDEDVSKQMDPLELRPLQELLHHKQDPFVLSDQFHESQAEKIRRQSLIGKFSVFVKKPLDKIQHKQSQVITDGGLFKNLTLQDPLVSSSDLKTLQDPVLLSKQLAKEPCETDSDPYLLSSPHLTPLQIQSIFNRKISTTNSHSKSNSPSESPHMSSNFLFQRGTKLVDSRMHPSNFTAPYKDSESESDSIRTTETLECRKRVKHNHASVRSNASKLLKGQPLSKSWNGVDETATKKFHLERTPQEALKGRASSHHPLESLAENKPERKNSLHRDVGKTKDHTRPSQPKAFLRRCSADKQEAKKEDSACVTDKTTVTGQMANLNQVGISKSGSINSHNTPDRNGNTTQTLSSACQGSLKRCKSGREGASTAPLAKISLVRSKSGKGDDFLRHTMLHQDVQQICVQEAKTEPEQTAIELSETPLHDILPRPHVEQEIAMLVERKQVLPNAKDLPIEHSSGQEKVSKTRAPAVNPKEKVQAAQKSLASSLSSKQPNPSNFNGKKSTVTCNKSFDPGHLQRLTKRKQSTKAEEDHKRNEFCAVKSLSRRRVTPAPCVPNTKMSSGTKNGKAFTELIMSESQEGGRVPLGTLVGERNRSQSKPAKTCTEQKVNIVESHKLRPKRQSAPKKVPRNGRPPSESSKIRKTPIKEKMDSKKTKDSLGLVVVRKGITVKGDSDSVSVEELTRDGEKLDDSATSLDSEMLESNKISMQGEMLGKPTSPSGSRICIEESIEPYRGSTLEQFDNLWDTCRSAAPVTSNQPHFACHSNVPAQELSNLSSIEICIFREQLSGALHEKNDCNEAADNARHQLKGIDSSGFHPMANDCLDEICQPSPISVLDIPFQDESPKASDNGEVLSRNEELEDFQDKALSNSYAAAHLKVRESADVSTTEDFIQSERIMEAILGISRIRHIDPCSLGIKEAIDMACAEDEVRYMHDILSASEFLLEEDKFMEDSFAQGLPIEVSVFQNLETQDNTSVCRENSEFGHSDEDDDGLISLLASKRSRGSFLQRKLLFDCFNEALSLKLRSLWSEDPLAGKLFVKLRRLSGQKELIDEIHRQTCKWRELAGSMTEELVETDMNSGIGKWNDVKQEVREVGLDVERMIFKTIVEEIISDMIE